VMLNRQLSHLGEDRCSKRCNTLGGLEGHGGWVVRWLGGWVVRWLGGWVVRLVLSEGEGWLDGWRLEIGDF
jgi:hypothetical protein